MRNPTTVAAPPLHCADHTCAAGSSPIPSFAISSVQPRGGPTAGGTKVQLRGRGLHELVDCAFGPYPRSRAFAVDPDPGAWAVGKEVVRAVPGVTLVRDASEAHDAEGNPLTVKSRVLHKV